MNFEKIISALQRKLIGGIIITDRNSHQIYRDPNVDVSDNFFSRCSKVCPINGDGEDLVAWEFLDRTSHKYYYIQSAKGEVDGQLYQLHQLTNISEIVETHRTLNQYSSELNEMMQFQSEMIENLSGDFNALLSVIKDYFKVDEAALYIERDSVTEKIVCADETSREIITDPSRTRRLFEVKNGEHFENYVCFVNNSIAESHYAVFLRLGNQNDSELFRSAMLEDNIRLYVENAVLRDKTIYESEHDKMTGLYNKGKYMQLIRDFFPSQSSIAVFNMDVNNLKMMNDNFGHEAGDHLLIKAADSIRMALDDNTYGFRIGGDEYMMIACGISLNQANKLKEKWEDCLLRLNERDDGINCIIACGMSYGAGDELEVLLKTADSLMYEDKRAKKKG